VASETAGTMAGMPIPDKGDEQEHAPHKNPAPPAFAAPLDRINQRKKPL
jgi:hypothetical protein